MGKKKLKIIFPVIAVVVIAALAVLYLSSKAKTIPPQEAQGLLPELSPIAQNFFDGLTSRDYEKASRNFNGIMREKMPPQQLKTLYEQINEKIGDLVNLGSPKISKQGENITLEYQAEFGKEKNVTIRIVFNKENDGYKISGLWFDSPKLRQ